MLWKSVQNGADRKPRKIPHYASGEPRSGALDGAEDVRRLATFDTAVAALQGGAYAGLGFALGADGTGAYWQGIDFDGLDKRPALQFLVDEGLPGYVERSPSGNGVHAIGYGRRFKPLGSNTTGIEAYAGARFFTVTGESVSLGEPEDLADFVESRLAPMHSPAAAKPGRPEAEASELSPEALARLVPELRSALGALDADDRHEWIAVGMRLKSLGRTGREMWLTWSQTSQKFDPAADAARVWDSLKPDHTGYAAVFASARAAGSDRPGELGPARLISVGGAQAPEFSEEALALEFADHRADGLRWVQLWGRWMAYLMGCWRPDETLGAITYSRKICRAAAQRCNKARLAKALASSNTVAAVERLARSDPRLAATVDQWDADPWALNTPGGVVMLKTGKMRRHRPTDFMTKSTSVAPGGECPLWLSFLGRVTGGDKALEGFLQRMAGYALTGDVSAHALFFGHGPGANGKTVFIETIAGILGDYHRTSPIETFVVSHSDRHPTELANLQGARLVTATETEEGRHWAESKIKALTGGDKIAARFMRQDFFEFTPQFKLLLVGNHKPALKNVGEAIRRRFHLIHFPGDRAASPNAIRTSLNSCGRNGRVSWRG